MNLFHRHSQSDEPSDDAEAAAAEAEYDAQSDLALPTSAATTGQPDVGVPYGGMVDLPPEHPAYDVERDTAT